MPRGVTPGCVSHRPAGRRLDRTTSGREARSILKRTGCYGHPRVMQNYFVGAATTTSVSALHSPTVALLRMSTSRPMATLRNL
jgi:hypothetical protein